MADKNTYISLADLGKIKTDICLALGADDDIVHLVMPYLDDEDFDFEENWLGGVFTKTVNGEFKKVTLQGYCVDYPYLEDTISNEKCAIFVETFLSYARGKYVKDVIVEISIISHKNASRLTQEDKKYFTEKGIYGNKVDCLIQLINNVLSSKEFRMDIQEKISIGQLQLLERNPVQIYTPGTKYYGKIMRYAYVSFNEKPSVNRGQ